jgi:hypothetical protein
MRRLIVLPLLLVLAGCDAGNRAAPGSDNAQTSPVLVISTPHEGQQVVTEPKGSPVRALFDLQGGRIGRTAGSTVRWKLERLVAVPAKDQPTRTPVKDWTVVEDPARAVSLGVLEAATRAETAYVLTAEVLDKDGKPWTREEPAKDAGGAPRIVNPAARVVRTFTVHDAWKDPAKQG